MQIASNHVVTIDYKLTDESGDLIDSSEGMEPLAYLHGAGNIVVGLEEELTGKAVGDTVKVSVPPEKGYGPRDDERMGVVPRANFEGVEKLEAGMQFQAQTPDGVETIVVTKVEGEDIHVDANHPLAGMTLNFEVSVREVRAATKDELEHGHAHGDGGHHH